MGRLFRWINARQKSGQNCALQRTICGAIERVFWGGRKRAQNAQLPAGGNAQFHGGFAGHRLSPIYILKYATRLR